jgi:hypothetical protein
MAWYAYCVTEKQAFPELLRHRKPIPLAEAHGIHGNQVFLYPAGDFAVLVSQYLPCEDAASPSCAKAHFKVVADCFANATVLPFRFGTVFAGDEALRRTIRSNSRTFAADLAFLTGKVEMHIRMTLDDCCRDQWTGPQPVESSVGREYLTNLRQTAARSRERSTLARTITTQMHRMFAPLAEEASCRLENGKMQLVLSHLIERRSLQRYVNKFHSTRLMMQSCEMHLSGPLPPYHFIHNNPSRPAVAASANPALLAATASAPPLSASTPLSA